MRASTSLLFRHVSLVGAPALHVHPRYKTVTIQTLMHHMGTDHLDVVRMDCEGAEWGVLNQW